VIFIEDVFVSRWNKL